MSYWIINVYIYIYIYIYIYAILPRNVIVRVLSNPRRTEKLQMLLTWIHKGSSRNNFINMLFFPLITYVYIYNIKHILCTTLNKVLDKRAQQYTIVFKGFQRFDTLSFAAGPS